MIIYLIGFIGSGKSYLAKELAALTHSAFIDLDQVIYHFSLSCMIYLRLLECIKSCNIHTGNQQMNIMCTLIRDYTF